MRATIARLLPGQAGWPVATLTVNLVGAFALGVLLETLILRRPRARTGRRIRLLFGTGLLGGFTTYSTLAVETVHLLESQPWQGIGYLVGSVVVGIAAAALGVWTAARATGAAR